MLAGDMLRSQRGIHQLSLEGLEQLLKERSHSRPEGAGGNDITTEVKVTVFKTTTVGLWPCQLKLITYR